MCRQAIGNNDGHAGGPFVTCSVRRPNKARIKKHHRSSYHQRSVLALLHHRGLANVEDDGVPAPPVAEFAALLQRIRRNELEAVTRCRRRKQTTMAWCLYEAQRDTERKFLAKAVCMSIAQDASTRGSLLLTRYVACGPSLERVSGILRVADAKKISGAPDLAKSVLRGIRAMATKRRPHAGMYEHAGPIKRLKGFADHLASITEVFVADGASDEQLAGRMLMKGSARGTLADTLPNLRLVVRDKPHRARLLLQRTLPKDAYISKLMTTLLWSRGSLAMLVKHSPQFQEKFKHHQLRHSPAGNPVKDLSYAKHRFDSTARPLGRMVVHFEALLQTAMDIVRERGPSTKEHQSANRALELLDTEAMLQLGMVADACEAVVRFIRFLDKECFEISALPAHIDTLAATATELFHNGGCLKHAGYTLQMLESIKHPRLVVMSGGQPKTLGEAGGPSKDIIARCMGRMVNWWRLAEAVLATEFPDWDLLLQFDAFNVPRDHLVVDAQTRKQLQRLSESFAVDEDHLLQEYEDVCPVASQFAGRLTSQCAASGDACIRSWRHALEYCDQRPQGHSTKHLRPILFRLAAYIGSSSGVEQGFSQCLAQFRHLRNFNTLGVQRTLVLAGTRGEEDQALYSQARQIWAQHFSAPRRQRKFTIVSARTLRQIAARKLQGNTEAAARRRRAADLNLLLGRRTSARAAISDAGGSAASRLWGAEQEREMDRQKALQNERRLDAADMGCVTADTTELQKYRAKQKATHRRYMQKRHATAKARQHVRFEPGTPTWVDNAHWDDRLRQAFVSRKARRVTDLSQAQAYVVEDAAAPPRMIDLAASLVGGLVLSIAYFVNPPGPAVQYGRALIGQRRALWISRACQEAAPKTIDLIKTVSARSDSEWRSMGPAEFSRRAAAAKGHRRNSGLVALVAAEERRLLPVHEQRHCQSLAEFAVKCRHLAFSRKPRKS